jgi:hypothetical protein
MVSHESVPHGRLAEGFPQVGGRPTWAFVLRRVAKTPAKHEENWGFGNSKGNRNGDAKEQSEYRDNARCPEPGRG